MFLISIDCLRPDYVGAYNRLRRQTPTIDGIAAEAVLFTEAVCHATFTTPAVASLLAGAYPPRTGVRLLLGQLCEPTITTVAEYARRAGLTTGGFPSNFILNSPTGLSRGFDYYRDVVDGHRSGRGGCWQTGDQLNAALDRFLTDAGQQPVFCWLHYFDLHDYHVDRTVPIHTSYPRDLRDRIDAECLGEFQTVLRRHHRLDGAAIILTADHGECLMQHGERGHGHHVYDSVLRVPLIWRWPGLTGDPRQIDQQVRHVDILPTLLDLWGIPRGEWPADLDGRSLVPLMRGESMEPATSYAEASPRQLFQGDIKAIKQFAGPEMQAIRTEEFKYIVHDNGDRELYALRTDPLEMANRVEAMPDVAEQMDGQLRDLLRGRESCFASAAIAPEDEQLVVQRLRDLGYVA
ncbi:MAG: sulfatase-like hydrolase/transferase [Planctomycetes bacterium]|nr:sulfatase-like hydrolase/transferase [Planctomycetota bacterium]